MPFYIRIDPREISLINHAEFPLFDLFPLARSCGEIEVESTLEDGGVGDRFDDVEGKELEWLFEALKDAGGEEEEVAFFCAPEGFHMVGCFTLADGLGELGRELRG